MTPPPWRGSPFAAPTPADLDRTLGDRLHDLAAAHPDAPAVIAGDRAVGFAALAGLVGGLARQIAAADAAPGPVALLQPPGVLAVAAWFACSLAGRPLLLLEPTNPIARTVELATLAGATIVLRGDDGPVLAGTVTIVPDGRVAPIARGSGLAATAPAMIFPTSGSTGEPKLVAYATQTLLAKALASRQVMQVGRGDTVLIAGSHGNYGFLHHAIVFLLAGGTLCLLDLRDAGLGALFATIRARAVGHVRFTPSLFRAAAALPEAERALGALRGVRFSGEPLLWNDVAIARRILDPACRIQNVYGSTESAIFAWTDDRSRPVERGVAPIGRIYPLWDYAIRAEDDAAAAGDVTEGRLVVRSAYQALGDWRAGAIDGSRFTDDPSVPGLRLYDTGDIVRQSSDGDLTMLGRSDRLVKVNGFRVSLAEIEAHLRIMPGCGQAAVIARAGARGISLAAFITRESDGALPDDGRAWLAARLPASMVPARLRVVEALPLLPGGKLDYPGLAARLDEGAASASPAAADAPTDGVSWLARIWTEVLAMPDAAADPDRDFFDLGGDSLRLLELRLAIERHFAAPIDHEAFLDRPTLRHLAALLHVDGLAAPMSAYAQGALGFQCVRRAEGPSRGVALAMPGWGGSPRVRNWLAADVFTGFDVWTCTVALPSGTIMDGRRWLAAARDIAAAVKAGACPAPTIVFGFSIAGYIAWLVDRLLADTAVRPQRIVCLDVTPLHRHPGYARRDVRRIAAARMERGRMLSIHRAAVRHLRWPIGAMRWAAADAHLSVVAVRALEHADMDTAAVLAATRPAIRTFVASAAPLPDLPTRDAVAAETPSAALFDLVCDPTAMTPERIARLIQDPPSPRRDLSRSALLYLVVAHAGIRVARAFVEDLRRRDPQPFDLRYAALALADVARGEWIAPIAASPEPWVGTPDAIDAAISLRPDHGDRTVGALPRRARAWARRAIARRRALDRLFALRLRTTD